jgi:hypothetical protein
MDEPKRVEALYKVHALLPGAGTRYMFESFDDSLVALLYLA